MVHQENQEPVAPEVADQYAETFAALNRMRVKISRPPMVLPKSVMDREERMRAVFVGLDSAWGANNTGAICELMLQEDGTLILQKEPILTKWDDAIDRAGRHEDVGLSVWAIDQPICVANDSGCRPVDVDLARALMADFGCGAHSANLSNPCWAANARIWDLLRTLAVNGYEHNPMGIPQAEKGRLLL